MHNHKAKTAHAFPIIHLAVTLDLAVFTNGNQSNEEINIPVLIELEATFLISVRVIQATVTH